MPKPKILRRSDGYDERSLLMSAADHLEAVDCLRAAGFRVLDSAGYLAQLTVELMLKAYLLHVNDGFPKTHDLNELLDDCAASGLAVSLEPNEEVFIQRLHGFADLRYPSTKNPVSISSEDFGVLDQVVVRVAAAYPTPLQRILKNLYVPDQDGLIRKGTRILMFKPRT